MVPARTLTRAARATSTSWARGGQNPSVLAPRLLVLGFASLVGGCGAGATDGQAPAAPAQAVVAVPAGAVPLGDDGSLLPSAPRSTKTEAGPITAPEGYQEMTVAGVAPTADGEAVLLVDQERTVIVPIFVGGTEALSIQLRSRKQRYERPLTHDLLDAVMRELGGSLVKVHVDDLKGTTFVGAIFLRVGNKTVEIDARPSDAIALAIGNHVPIFVAKRVIAQTGVHEDAHPTGTGAPGPVPRI